LQAEACTVSSASAATAPSSPPGNATQSSSNGSSTSALSPLLLAASDGRTQLLQACQAGRYASWPSVSVGSTSSPGVPTATDAAPIIGTASQPNSSWLCSAAGSRGSRALALSYAQSQCAEGYTGLLCASCQPGSFLTPTFQCRACHSVAQTAVLSVLQLLFTVAVILYTVGANARDAADDDGEEPEGHDEGAADKGGQGRQAPPGAERRRRSGGVAVSEVLKTGIVYAQVRRPRECAAVGLILTTNVPRPKLCVQS
jgi:hypothetical protein